MLAVHYTYVSRVGMFDDDLQADEKPLNKLAPAQGHTLLAQVVEDVKFKDGL